MGLPGYLSMRNAPCDAKGEILKYLKRFFEKHTLCPMCNGFGSNKFKEKHEIANATVRFSGMEQLVAIREFCSNNFSEVIRDILHQEICGKVLCKFCHGQRFVSNQKARTWKKKNSIGTTKESNS